MMDAMNRYRQWCESSYFDEETKAELYAIRGDEAEIQERFYRDLEFGTGGLRGILGAGTNRMNRYTVRKATQGLANYMKKEGVQKKGAAIAYDSRRFSPEFAREAALCLAANGIKAYVFESLRPTPELSFALRELGCAAGIVVTASHNPPEYNGYKVYWEDGAQITPPRDGDIISEVNAIMDYSQVETMDWEEAKEKGLYQEIGAEIDDRYMEELKKLILNPEIVREQGKRLKIVYTPLHGTGNLPVRRILREIGFEQVIVVPEQELPDGNFPTVSYPNPEDKKAFALALALAEKEEADLVLATDPDADRLGIYARDWQTGEYRSFTGNMSGMLILEYRLSQLAAQKQLPENGAVVTTVVSGKMSEAIADRYQVRRIETLTGFKYIGEQIHLFEQDGRNSFLFGYEESYGCLVGTHARDKDAVVAVMALCEAAAWYASQGISLCGQMERLFQTYGFYQESLFTITLKGMEGAARIREMMEAIRSNPPEKLGGLAVKEFRDYKAGRIVSCADGSERPSLLPTSDVLYFVLDQDAWCCIRPSGTEPKIKCYVGVKGEDREDAERRLKELERAVGRLLE